MRSYILGSFTGELTAARVGHLWVGAGIRNTGRKNARKRLYPINSFYYPLSLYILVFLYSKHRKGLLVLGAARIQLNPCGDIPTCGPYSRHQHTIHNQRGYRHTGH